MIPEDEVFARVAQAVGEIDPQQRQLLRILSGGAAAMVRRNEAPGDMQQCVAAASLYALAGFLEADRKNTVERFTAGDVTVEPGSGAEAAASLRRQADRILMQLHGEGFSFRRA